MQRKKDRKKKRNKERNKENISENVIKERIGKERNWWVAKEFAEFRSGYEDCRKSWGK
jgi:hypothetical protein